MGHQCFQSPLLGLIGTQAGDFDVTLIFRLGKFALLVKLGEVPEEPLVSGDDFFAVIIEIAQEFLEQFFGCGSILCLAL
ncbi:MAG: hypothetical protein HYR56_15750 [Acidobacteria bacterium]|nr:hypothetical protein [Acidobacteriota bacterium]MBI3425155.1 hypothetical protein [Acidobacteriota bacterium]